MDVYEFALITKLCNRANYCLLPIFQYDSFISQVRLTTMSTPDRAWVIHDDGTDLQSPTPTCYVSHVRRLNVALDIAAITLSLRLNFANSRDKIMMEAIGVTLAQRTPDLSEVICMTNNCEAAFSSLQHAHDNSNNRKA
jgi:hypothetical protein